MVSTGLAASAGLTTAELNWSPAAGPFGVEAYAVFRNGVPIGRTATTGYVFAVAAFGAAGRLATSQPVTLLTQSASV